MTPGLSGKLLEVNDARKTAVINIELRRLQIDIVTLQETRLPTTGSIREKDFTFIWQGKPPEEVREHGIGFAIMNRLLGSIVLPTEESARIIKLQLHTVAGLVSLINAYAPTLTSSTEPKDELYDDLGLTLRDIPQQEPVFLLGDFNARVGFDHRSWPSCLGQFGFGKMNKSGQCLLEFCCHHDLCITNSFFDTKLQHKATGSTQNRTAPLNSVTGEIIKDRDQQMNRWMEHYSEFYSRENLVSIEALDAIECLPIMEELDLQPTVEEVEKAVDSLSSGKGPGDNGIPPEVLKCARGTLKTDLHELLCQCWREDSVQQHMGDANIIPRYKNKGDRNDVNNYRGISLLNVVGKLFARVVLVRLQILADRVYPDSQCGSRAERSTTDMVFSLRQLQEKEFIFADNTAITTHTAEGLQQLLNRFAAACSAFGLIISLKKAQVMVQDVNELPCINIADYVLEAVLEFVYLGFIISDTLSLDTELNWCIRKAATTLARLTKRVWENAKLTVHTKAQVYMTCVVSSTLLYGSES
ncbi:uncharacterized protein [Procambarus clarkii]|uniref:uncharacterized protein n=1 Tax=Procambarus clarkii TaxID=6728 RepID=UPI0037420874